MLDATIKTIGAVTSRIVSIYEDMATSGARADGKLDCVASGTATRSRNECGTLKNIPLAKA